MDINNIDWKKETLDQFGHFIAGLIPVLLFSYLGMNIYIAAGVVFLFAVLREIKQRIDKKDKWYSCGWGCGLEYRDFQLRDLVDYTDSTTLYDKYKLAFVKVRIIPLATSVSTAAAYSSVFSQSSMIIHSILDCDDNANAPATAAGVDQLRQYQT